VAIPVRSVATPRFDSVERKRYPGLAALSVRSAFSAAISEEIIDVTLPSDPVMKVPRFDAVITTEPIGKEFSSTTATDSSLGSGVGVGVGVWVEVGIGVEVDVGVSVDVEVGV